MDARLKLFRLSFLVSTAFAKLRQERQALYHRKHPYSQPSSPGTPLPSGAENSSFSNHASCRDIVENIKSVLYEELLTPGKRCESCHFDSPHDDKRLQQVVQSLESQMDNLLKDLEAANASLRDKDIVFAEMELHLKEQELERGRLQKEISVLSEKLYTAENGRQESTREKSDDPSGISPCYGKVSNDSSLEVARILPQLDTKTSAVKHICGVFQRQEKARKAVAFRKWYCSTSVMHATANQKKVAMALSQQLQITRDKLLILKSHLKQGRRSQIGEDGRKPRLRRLLDRLDKREKWTSQGDEGDRLDL